MRRPRGDDGAYAILYALLLVVVIGTAALVVDLAGMRQDRRQSRLASDAAVVAAARNLDPLGTPNPKAACEEAWSYVHTNLGTTVPSTTGCGSFPTTYPTSCSPIPAVNVADATSGDVRVRITWPVLSTSTLMTSPDAAPADSTTTDRPVDPRTDGNASDACTRIAVTISQSHEPAFASLFGLSGTKTTVTSVARAAITGGPGKPIAALNVLNRTACQALHVSGQGFIRVDSVGGKPGIIAVESSGAACGTKWVIHPADNGVPTGYIRADGPVTTTPVSDGVGKGIILTWALQPAPTGNPTHAYSTTDLTKLAPTPTLLTVRSGSKPVTDIYGCNSGCSVPYISDLRTAYGGTSMPPVGRVYAGSPFPYNTLPFVPFTTCNVRSSDVIVMEAANYYVDCPSGLNVRGILVFKGGNVVVRGDITIFNNACFATNVPVTSTTAPGACPTVVARNVATPPSTESILYLQNGSISRNGGSFFAANTFTYLASGRIDFGGNPGTVLMTNPRLDPVPSGCDQTCQDKRFYKVSLWGESGGLMNIGGQGSLYLRGVLFVPNSKFNYGGQADQLQEGAQFWADTIENSGQGGLSMAPNPDDAVPTPILNVQLIR